MRFFLERCCFSLQIVKQSEALSLKAGILCKMSDFYSAKSILMKAWKLKTPNPSDREDIEKNLKTGKNKPLRLIKYI